jgi:hypothetical protein
MQVNSQSFINGNLEGVVDPFDPTIVLSGWNDISYLENYCQATSFWWATPDITNYSGPFQQYGISGYPSSGSSFVSGLLAQSDTSIWHEGIEQTVSGFIPFQEYRITFYQSNVKQVSTPTFSAIDESGGWSIYLDDVLLLNSALSYSNLVFDDLNLQWDFREFTFIASDTVHTFGFLPYDDDSSIDGLINEALRMGIDDINLELIAGLNEAEQNEIKVYPNPTENLINIEFNNPNNAIITLFDLQGHVVNRIINHQSLSTDLEINAPPGMYILRVISEDGLAKHFNVRKI